MAKPFRRELRWNEHLDTHASVEAGRLIQEIEDTPDEEACVRSLERLRWREGFVCPKCSGEGEPWRMKRGLLLCRVCRTQTSVTAGTIKEIPPLREYVMEHLAAARAMLLLMDGAEGEPLRDTWLRLAEIDEETALDALAENAHGLQNTLELAHLTRLFSSRSDAVRARALLALDQIEHLKAPTPWGPGRRVAPRPQRCGGAPNLLATPASPSTSIAS